MKQARPESPFAALNSQEQKERWIVWQAQHDATKPIGVSLPDPRPEPPRRERAEKPAPAPIHHAQYDAVIGRMNAARRQTGGFVQASQSSTRQPSSGRE